MANTTLGQFYDSISSQLEYNNQQLLEEKQRRIDDINRQTALLQEAEARKNTDPDWLRNRINQKLEDIKNTYKSKAEMYAAIKNDPELRGQFTSDNAIWDVIGKLTGTYRADDLQPLNKEVSAEDDTSNSWLYRQFVKAERGAESVIRDMSSSVNDALGGMGLTEGSYDYKIRKENEHISELPLIELNNIDEKQNLISHLSSELSAIESEISQASYLDLPQLLQQKANLQKQIQLTTLTPEEQKLVDDGTYADYKGSIANIQQLQEDKAKWVGDTWLTWIDKDIVNDVDSYHQYIKEAKARGLDKQYEDAGLEPSWLNLSYALDKSLQMAGDADMAKIIGEIAPFMALEFFSGGTATPALLGGLGLRGLAKVGTSFLANQVRNLSTRQVASWGLLSSDAYSRYNEYISEQYAKDPQGTVDKMRAAEGAIAGVMADFFGSKIATGVAGKGFEKMLSKAPEGIAKRFADINKGIQLGHEIRGASKEFNSSVMGPAEALGNINRITNGGFVDALRKQDIADILEPVTRAERGVNKGFTGKLYNTLTAPARAVEGLNKLDKSLARKGLAPVRDAGKAGAYLGMENAMSETARQYGTGTDIEDMNWNQVAEAAVSGIGSGALFHYPGVGFHAVGSLARKAAKLKNKERLIPLNDKALKDFENKYFDKNFNDVDKAEMLKGAIEFTQSQKEGLAKEKSKAYAKVLNKVGEQYFTVTKDPQDNSIITNIALKSDIKLDAETKEKADKALAEMNEDLAGLDKLSNQADTVLNTLESFKIRKEKNDIQELKEETVATAEGQETIKEVIRSENDELLTKLKSKYKEFGFNDNEVDRIINSYKDADSTVNFVSPDLTKEQSEDIKEFLSTNRTIDDALMLEYYQGITNVNKDLSLALAEVAKDPTNQEKINTFKNELKKLKAGKDNTLKKKAKFWDSILDEATIKSKAKSEFTSTITDKEGTVQNILDSAKKTGEDLGVNKATKKHLKPEDILPEFDKVDVNTLPTNLQQKMKDLQKREKDFHTALNIIKEYEKQTRSIRKRKDVVKYAKDKGLSENALILLQRLSSKQYTEKQFKDDKAKQLQEIKKGYEHYKNNKETAVTTESEENFYTQETDQKELHKGALNNFILANKDGNLQSISRTAFSQFLEDNGITEDKDIADEVHKNLLDKITKVIEKHNSLVNVPLTTDKAKLDKDLSKTIKGNKVSDFYTIGTVTINGTTFYYAKETDAYGLMKQYSELYTALHKSKTDTITDDAKNKFKELYTKLQSHSLTNNTLMRLGVKDLDLKDTDSDELTRSKLQAINVALTSLYETRNEIVTSKRFTKDNSLLTNRYSIEEIKQYNKRLEDDITQINNQERLGQTIKDNHMSWLKNYKTVDKLQILTTDIVYTLGIPLFNALAKADSPDKVREAFKKFGTSIYKDASTSYLDTIVLHIDVLISRAKTAVDKAVLRKYKHQITLINNVLKDDTLLASTKDESGLVLGTPPQEIQPNKISDRVKEVDRLFPKVIEALDKVNIHADASLYTENLVETEYGIFVHREEASDDLLADSLQVISEANTSLRQAIVSLVKTKGNTLDTLFGTNALQDILRGIKEDSLINSIFGDNRFKDSEGVRALRQALKESDAIASLEQRVDFVNKLPATQQADIAMAIVCNRAWQINKGLVKNTMPILSATSTQKSIDIIDSYKDYERQAQDTLNDFCNNLPSAKNALKYTIMSSMVSNGLMSMQAFSDISTGLKYSLFKETPINYDLFIDDFNKGKADESKITKDELVNIIRNDLTEDEVTYASINNKLKKFISANKKKINNDSQESIISFIKENIYKDRYNQALKDVQKDNAVDYSDKNIYSGIERANLTTFNTAYTRKDKVVDYYAYRDSSKSVANADGKYTIEDIQRFRTMLRYSNLSKSSKTKLLDDYKVLNKDKTPTKEIERALQSLQNNLNNPLFSINPDIINEVGNFLANYIDRTSTIKNSTVDTSKQGANTIKPPKPTNPKEVAVVRDVNTGNYTINNSPKKATVFGNGFEGISEFERSSKGTEVEQATKEVSTEIKNLVKKIMKTVKVNERSLLSKMYGQYALGQLYLNEALVTQVVATAYNNITSISGGKPSDEFLSSLASMGCSNAMIKYYTENRILDFNTLATQLGNQIVKQLGLNFGEFIVTETQLAMELGGLALDSLSQLGVIDLLHISKSELNSHDESLPRVQGFGPGGLPNSLKGVKILGDMDKHKAKLDKLEYIDSNNAKRNYLDETLGSYIARDEYPFNSVQYKEYQNELKEDFDDGAHICIYGQIKDKKIPEIRIHINKVAKVAKVVFSSTYVDTNDIDVNGNQSTYTPDLVVYLDKEQILKKDGTYVEAERLLELARKQSSPKTLYHNAMRNSLGIFDGFSQVDIEAINDWVLPDNADYNSWTEEQLKQKAIREYIDFEDADEKAIGDERDNIRNKNVTQAIKAFKTWQYLKTYTKDTPIYFKEVNSVNNRSLVRGLYGNYREDPHNRPYYDYNATLPSINDLANEYKVNPENIKKDLTLFAKTSILANLGFGYDKAEKSKDNDEIEKAWNIIQPELSKVLDKLDLTSLKSTQALFKTFNDTIKTAVDKLKDTDKPLYKIMKKVKLNYDSERITTLHYMKQMTNVDWSKFEWDDNLKDNWHIKFEIDGLTNGPAIKGWIGTAFLSKFNKLSQKGRLAAGISSVSDYGELGYLGTFVDLKKQGTDDTYLLNGKYVTEEVTNRLAEQMVEGKQDAINTKDFLALTYITEFEEGTDLNSLTIGETFDVVLSRDMLKPPTMVTNYGAGYKALVRKMLSTFNVQASSLFANYLTDPTNKTKSTNLQNWLRKACALNGGSISLAYKENNGSITKIFLNAEGDVSFGYNGSSDLNIFTNFDRCKVYIKNSTLDLALNTNLANKVTENFINPMWDGMTVALEPFKRMDSVHGKIAQATADMLNIAILQECKDILDTPNILDRQEDLEKAINRAVDRINPILTIGSTQLNQVKDSKTEILTNLFSTILEHKDGKFFLKNQVNLALKEGLGAGLVPVSTHTQDSSIMHLMQHCIRDLVGETLGVHDAVIVDPTQAIAGGTGLNKEYWLTGIRSYQNFAKRNKKFASNIENFITIYGAKHNGLINQAYSLLREAEREYEKVTTSRIIYLNDQLAMAQAKKKVGPTQEDKELAKQLDTFNQYAFLNYTVYEPSVDEIDDELKELRKFDPLNPYNSKNTDVGEFIQFLNDKAFILCKNNKFLQNIFVKDNITYKRRLNLEHPEVSKNINSVNELVNFLKNNTGVGKGNQSNQDTREAIDALKKEFDARTTAITDVMGVPSKDSTTNNLFKSEVGKPSNKVRSLYNMFLEAEQITASNVDIIQNSYHTGIQKARALLRTRGINSITGLLAMIGACSDISSSEISTFYELFQRIIPDSSVDTAFTDSNVFTTVNEAIKTDARIHVNVPGDKLNINSVQYQINKNMISSQGTKDAKTMAQSAEEWFSSNIEQQVLTKYGSMNNKDVVVFSMSSFEDLLELQAIARLWANSQTNNSTLPKFKIAIQPKITEYNSAVNSDVQYVKNIKDTIGEKEESTWFVRTVPNNNKNFKPLEFLLGHKVNNSYVNEGIYNTGSYSYLDNKSKFKTEELSPLNLGKVAITKTNEYGQSYSFIEGKSVDDYSNMDFTSMDLQEQGIQDMGANDVEVIPKEQLGKYKYIDLEGQDIGVLDIKTELNNIKQMTMVFDTYTDGSIIDNRVKALIETDNQLKALKRQYEVIRSKRYADYYNNKISKEVFTRPIYVTLPATITSPQITAVFRVTINNFIDPKKLKDLVNYKIASNGARTKYAQSLNLDHPLMRDGLFDPERLDQVAAWVRENKFSSASEIAVPSYLINPKLKEKPQQLGEENDHYLDKLKETKGIKFYAFFTASDPTKSDPQGKGFVSLKDVDSCYFVPLSSVKPSNMVTVGKEANISFGDRIKTMVTTVANNLKGYSKADIKLNAKQVKIVDDKLQIATKQDLHNAMSKALADDKARGIDTSHLESMMGLVENLAMKIQLVETKDSSDSGEGVISSGLADKAIYVQYGKNYTGSSLEVLMHEIMHGVFEHLHLDPSAQRQAMQLFKYASSNLKLEHFECDKAEAERIMKYIFNDSSANNLQEFLAYAMTNSDFQIALTNMGINKDIAKEFFTKTKSVTSRLFNTLCTNLDSDTVPTNMVQAVRDIFNVTYANSQKIWEAQRQFDTLSEEEKIDYLKTNGTFDSLVRDGLTKDSPLLKTLLDIQAINNNVFGGNDNTMSALTDAIRSLSDNHLGFVRELATSLEAVSPRNYEFIRLRQRAKVAIDMQRERVSSAINSYVAELTKDLPTKVKHQLTKFLVQADVSCLFDANTKLGEVSKLIKNPKARTQKIREIEQQLRSYQYGNYYINASKGLSSYITTGINTSGLGYRNAYEITSFAGSRYWNKAKDSNAGDLVDKLATLYAIDYYDKQDNNIYNKIPDETLGALLNLHNSIKTIEQEYVMRDTEQRYHIPKGQIHGGKTVGSYKLYPMVNKEAVKWSLPTSMTPTKLDPFYKGMFGDNSFITTHHAFRSSIPVDAGIYAMTDKFMGRVAKGIRVGNEKVSDDVDDLPKIRDYLSTRINNLNTTNPSFINPNSVDGGIVLSFATGGNLIGANFELNPVETNKKIGRNVKFTNVLGDLLGSSIERVSAPNVNTDIANTAIKLYEETKDKSNYFWIKEDSENPKERDYYRRIPYEAKVIFKEKYGDQGIPVPKSAATIVLGKEAVSSKKIDTEYYEAVKECRNTVADYAKHLLRHGSVGLAEDLASYLTKIGKSNIVIKGLSVSINNILSNTLTLTRHGLSPIEAIRDQMEGVQQVRELEALQAQLNPIIVKSTISNLSTADIKKKNAITQMMKALPIYPLYSEGVLGSIVEDLDDSDSFIKDVIDKYFSGTTANLLHNLANDEKAVAFKMFKDLADIGDKAGKYALFKHQPDTMPLKERLRRSTETFIDYAIPLPTGFDIVERVGLQNFLKYPLGIQSELINSLSQRPDDALKSLMIQASLGFSLPDAYSSLLGIGNFERGLNFPGLGIFFDSLSCLPTAKIANNLMDTF